MFLLLLLLLLLLFRCCCRAKIECRWPPGAQTWSQNGASMEPKTSQNVGGPMGPSWQQKSIQNPSKNGFQDVMYLDTDFVSILIVFLERQTTHRARQDSIWLDLIKSDVVCRPFKRTRAQGRPILKIGDRNFADSLLSSRGSGGQKTSTIAVYSLKNYQGYPPPRLRAWRVWVDGARERFRDICCWGANFKSSKLEPSWLCNRPRAAQDAFPDAFGSQNPPRPPK